MKNIFYPYTRCLVKMNKEYDAGWPDRFFIGVGIILETVTIPIAPLWYWSHELSHRDAEKRINKVSTMDKEL